MEEAFETVDVNELQSQENILVDTANCAFNSIIQLDEEWDPNVKQEQFNRGM